MVPALPFFEKLFLVVCEHRAPVWKGKAQRVALRDLRQAAGLKGCDSVSEMLLRVSAALGGFVGCSCG